MRKSQHSNIRFGLATLVAALVISACNCERTQPPSGTHPDVVANPVALSFAACPALDENNQPVADVFPDRQTFTLQNLGKSSAALTYTLSGDAKDQFKIVTEPAVDSLADGSEAEVAVEFTPQHAGDVTATLTIDDGDDTTNPITVSLVGSGSNLPAQPTIKISYASAPDSTEMTDCQEDVNGQISNCQIYFPDTYLDQTTTLNVKVQNLGCPALKITDISVDSYDGTSVPQFYMQDPAVPPSEEAPLVLSVAGETEANLKFRFEPKDDGTFDGQRYAIVNVKSNSPKSPSALTLYGYASQPSLYTTPTFCDFTDDADKCGGFKTATTGGNSSSAFQIVNGGNSDVTITGATLRTPNSGRFVLHADAVVGQTIAPGESIALPVDYTDAATYVTELADITGESTGMPTNTATIRLSGGVQPHLQVTPAMQLDFSDATTNPATKSIQICNAEGAGVLQITGVQVTQSPLFFSVTKPPAQTTLNAGECTDVEITFKRPTTGGIQTGTLEIQTNDPSYGPPSYFRLNLLSDVPLNQVPVAVLAGPSGQLNGFSVDLSTINPKEVTVDGSGSYDPPGTSTPPTKYYYYLVKTPTNAVAKLTTFNDKATSIAGKPITDNKVLLQLDQVKTGLYRVTLVVEDATGQKSSGSDLDIVVNP